MELSLFDLHCDTGYEMYLRKQALTENKLAVSLNKASVFRRYLQVLALWTNDKLSDGDGWNACLSMLENFRNDCALISGAALCGTDCPERDGVPFFFLSVEDARILENDLNRVDLLYRLGVRILTPLWGGETCIGGSHNTSAGLTPFGQDAVRHAVTLGMIPDISHASEASAENIFEIAETQLRPVIASHSNAYEVCPVSRNLRRGQISSVLRSGGIIGLNLHQPFLRDGDNVTVESLLPHITYFLEQGAEHSLCLGCDMDGAVMPTDLPDLSALPRLAELLLRQNYPEFLVRAIFFENAYSFFQNTFGNSRKMN